jgi:hypothetical protein
MPLHDWTQVNPGLFHDFHQTWSVAIKRALNRGLLPTGLSAFVEQKSGPREGDVLTIAHGNGSGPAATGGGTLLLERPQTRFISHSDDSFYAKRANRIVVRHALGHVVAVIELVSPGNKDGERAFRQFVDKVVDFVAKGVHVLVIDLFPPTPRDPDGTHAAVWDHLGPVRFRLPGPGLRTLASYEAGSVVTAFAETVAVGEPLPDMPLFLVEGGHVKVPPSNGRTPKRGRKRPSSHVRPF